MKFRRRREWLWLVLFAVLTLPATAEELFVVGDVYSFKPDGKCQERRDGELGLLRTRNAVWDGAAKTIRLFAAKNEEVAAQIVVPGPVKGCRGTMSDLAGPGTIPAGRASFSAIAWVNHPTAGLCADLVIPLDGSVKGIRSFDVPLAFEGLPKPENRAGSMLFEVWVPADARAGLHRGTVTVSADSGAIAKLNVELTVFDFAMPDMPTLLLDCLAYGSPAADLKIPDSQIITGNGRSDQYRRLGERALRVNQQVFKLTMDHRCFVNILPYPQRGAPALAYPVEGYGAEAKIRSFTEWDELFGPYLDGKLNKFNAPPAHFTLAFNINYPFNREKAPAAQFDLRPFKMTIPEGPGKEPALREFEETWKAVARQIYEHFAEKGWTRTRFELFHNQKPDEKKNRTPWKLDEPVSVVDYQGLRYLFNLGRQSFAGAAEKKVQVVNRLDIGHWNCERFGTPDGKPAKCYNPKEYNSGKAEGYLKGITDIWYINRMHAEAAADRLPDLAGPGVRAGIYTTSGMTDIGGSHVQFQGFGYLAARVGISAWVLYNLNLANGNPNCFPESPGERYGILWNGASMGFEGALPAHRLKLWRNAANDFDYLQLAMKKDPAAAKAVVDAMTGVAACNHPDCRKFNVSYRAFYFTNNAEDLTRAKAKLAAIIAGKVAANLGAIEGPSREFTRPEGVDGITGYD